MLLFLASLVIFAVLFVLPGDPAQIMLGINATPETLANLRAELGLDRPFWQQYGDWIFRLFSGKGSRSLNYDVPVSELLLSRLWVTGPLALMAMAMAILLSIPLGVYAARQLQSGGGCDRHGFHPIGSGHSGVLAGHLVDALLFGEIGLVFRGRISRLGRKLLGIFKGVGAARFCAGCHSGRHFNPFDPLFHAGGVAGGLCPDRLGQGVERAYRVVYRHALRNALIPVVTITGLQLGQLIAGAIIIENVYYLPGLGRLVFQAIEQRDFPVVREIVLFMAVAVILVNFIVDLCYALLDPRIRVR